MCQNIKKHTCEAMLFFRTAVTHKSHRFYHSDNATEPDQKKKNRAHRFQLFHLPALMDRVQGSVVQGRVYLLPLQILYRFLNSLCNITGAFVKSVLSHKVPCHKIYRNSTSENCHQIARNQKNNCPRR